MLVTELSSQLEGAHLANSALTDERDSLKAEKTAISELARLDDFIPLANTPLAYRAPRMYKYFIPSCVYPARVGRRRTFKYYSRLQQHRWMGGIVNKELMALARYEGLYATASEAAALRAYTADWDAMAEQMLNDSIPW